MDRVFHIHLVSDSTGETTYQIARACIVQFENVDVKTEPHNMVRSEKRLERVIEAIEQNPGAVLYTLMNDQLSKTLEQECRRMGVPCIDILDGVLGRLRDFFGRQITRKTGRQHDLDAMYFNRIEAIQYVLAHDDGQLPSGLEEADVILVGVSRTSKTPTSVYLANQRGIKAANVPFVPGVPLPDELFKGCRALIVGLTTMPERLLQIRKQRLRHLHEETETPYVDPELVDSEVREARRLFRKMKWPIIDVSRRSIEETAAEIFELYSEHNQNRAGTAQTMPDSTPT